MREPLGVGLVGYGMAGQVFHAPVIAAVPALRLAKVVERHAERSRERYPWVEVVRDVAALLEDEAIGLVVVATPNSSHFELARQALLAGKHVVVDKPFTVTSAQAAELAALARERGLVASAFHNRRWDGDFLTVRAVLAQGLLGRLVEYESHFDRFRGALRPGAWRERDEPGAGILFDLGPHLIDQALALFGLPQALTADVRVQREGAQVDDQFELILHYERLKVTLKAGMLVRELGPRFVLHGTEGSFVKYGLDPQEDALRRGLAPGGPGWGREPEAQWGTLNTQLGTLHVRGQVETLPGAYQAYYENVAAAILAQAALAVTSEAALDTLRLIEAARQSSAERRTVDIS